jgi:hypothetical protein
MRAGESQYNRETKLRTASALMLESRQYEKISRKMNKLVKAEPHGFRVRV